MVHHYEPVPATESVQVEVTRNTKGFNWTVNCHAATLDRALELVRNATTQLRYEYPE